MSADGLRLLSYRGPSLAATGRAPLAVYSDLSDPEQAYDFLGLEPDCDEASVWLRYDELSKIWGVDALKCKQASKEWTAIEEAFVAIRLNYKWNLQRPTSQRQNAAVRFPADHEYMKTLRSVEAKLQRRTIVFEDAHLIDDSKIKEKLRLLISRTPETRSSRLRLNIISLSHRDDYQDLQTLRTIGKLFSKNRGLFDPADYDTLTLLTSFMTQRIAASEPSAPKLLESLMNDSEHKVRSERSAEERVIPSVTSSEHKLGSSGTGAPEMFISYTISEDRSGTADEVMAARLAPLRSRDESSPFARASLALLHR